MSRNDGLGRADSHPDRQWQTHLNAQRTILAQLGEGSRRRFIDIGCGEATLAELFVSTYVDATAVGVDLYEDKLRSALRRLEQVGIEKVALVQGDARRLPLGSDCADVAAIVAVLAWVHPCELETLCEARRILTPGGQLLLASMIRQRGVRQFTTIVDSLFRRAARETQLAGPVPSFTARSLTISRLQSLAASAGLTIEATNIWRRGRKYASGEELITVIERAMRGFYWQGKGPEETSILRARVIGLVDAEVRIAGAFDIPQLNAILRCRKRPA